MPRLVRHKLVATGGARFGSSTNYTDIASDGVQTMVGTARDYGQIWLPAQVWYGQQPNQFANVVDAEGVASGSLHVVLPKSIYGGKAAASPINVPTLAASPGTKDLDCRAATAIFAPPDAASSGSSTLTLYYTTSNAKSTAGSIQAWRVNWQYFGSSTSDVGGLSGSILYGASMSSTGSGKLEIQTLGQIHAFRSSSPMCVLQLTLEGSNSSAYDATPTEQIYGMEIRYIREKLGAAT